MKQLIWMSFDLGVDGNYEDLYSWLDYHEARECGDNLAVLFYEYEIDFLHEIKKDLQKAIKIRKKDRIYVVYQDDKVKKYKGKFIFGGRKVAMWKGYAGIFQEDIEDEY